MEKKRLFHVVLLMVISFVMIRPIGTMADVAIKTAGPDIEIVFENMKEGDIYATILGPDNMFLMSDYNEWNTLPENVREIFIKLTGYDNYDESLCSGWIINSKDNELRCQQIDNDLNEQFCLYVYLPGEDCVVSSELTERYGYSSFYNVDASKMSEGTTIELNYSHSFFSSFVVMVLFGALILGGAIGIEFLFARWFGIRDKRSRRILLWVKVSLKICFLAVCIILEYFEFENSMSYHSPIVEAIALVLVYLVFKAVTLVIEAIVYCATNRIPYFSNGKMFLYALCSNIAVTLVEIMFPAFVTVLINML